MYVARDEVDSSSQVVETVLEDTKNISYNLS